MTTIEPLRTPNLDLTLDTSPDGDIAVMEVTGKMKADTLSESFEWVDGLSERANAENGVQMMVIMRQDNFDDLSEAAGGFRQVADVLRRVPNTQRCTVLTDSAWLRSTAKVESAVIPGMNIMTFDPAERDNAVKWLRDQPLSAPEPSAEKKEAAKASNDPWASLDLSEVA